MSDTIEHAGYTIRIEQDQDAESPREYDNLGTMVCWHSRYKLGDEQPKCEPSEFMEGLARDADDGLEEIENRVEDIENYFYRYEEPEREAVRIAKQYLRDRIEKVLADNYVIQELYLYDHSGITMRCGSFNDPWDSGPVGYIYCSLEKARENWMAPEATWDTLVKHSSGKQVTLREYTQQLLEGEVETYASYLEGDVYGYVVEDEDGEHVDSCWGFFGYDYCIEEAKQAADYARKQADELELSNAASGMHI